MNISLIQLEDFRKEMETRYKLAKEVFKCDSYVSQIYDRPVKVEVEYLDNENRDKDIIENVLQINTIAMGDVLSTEFNYITDIGTGLLSMANKNIKSIKIYNQE